MSGPRRKITELKADEVTIQFSTEVRQSLRDLEAAVHFSDHFDPDVRHTLRDLADGTRVTIRDLVGSLPLIIAETINHIHATNDQRARQALLELNLDLSGRSPTSEPISLETVHKGRGR